MPTLNTTADASTALAETIIDKKRTAGVISAKRFIMDENSIQKIIRGIISTIKYRNTDKLLFFVPLYAAYWALFPMMFKKFGISYSMIAAIFIVIASFLWGIKGGLLSVAVTAVIRFIMTMYLHLEFHGGIFAPIFGLTTALTLGALSDYVITLEPGRQNIRHKEKEYNPYIFPVKIPISAMFEVIALTALAVIIGIIAVYYDFFESLYHYSRQFEKYDLDELVIVSCVLVFFFGIFSYRRWQEVKREFQYRLKAEEALRDSENKYRAIIDNAFEGICIFQEAMTRFVNPYVSKTTGYDEEELLNRPFIDFVHPEDQMLVLERHYSRVSGENPPQNYVFRIISKNNETIWVRVTGQPIDWNNKPAALVFLRDETAILKAQEMLKSALREKDTLLREVHHRVKNNMQVIISLLNLQSSEIASEELKYAFGEAQNRVRAMSLAHEIIYRTESLSAIDLSKYLDTLCRNLLVTHNPPGRIVHLTIDITNVFMELSQAVPCGLLVNELVTNSLKHGFSGRLRGRINISAADRGQGDIELVIADDGTGLPDDMNWKTSKTLGLKMVNILAEVQLKGKLDYLRKNGACFIIQFRLKEKHEVENGSTGYQDSDRRR